MTWWGFSTGYPAGAEVVKGGPLGDATAAAVFA